MSADTKGVQELRDYCRNGGTVKRIWGALRGKYFQNAIQAGSYYIDVANDTVDPAKDKVEILPLQESGFRNIGSFHEFSDVAESYWKCRTVPNLFFPNLAPFFPIVAFFDDGDVRLESKNSFMFPMNLEKGLQLARDFVFNNSRREEDIETCRAILEDLLAAECNPDDNHLFHFSAARDDRKLAESFEACLAASPTAFAEKINDILRIEIYVGKSGFIPDFSY